jgi:hypothetical protein
MQKELTHSKQTIYFHKPKIDKKTITIYGAGKFGEERLILDKAKAMLLYIELHKFISNE